MPKLFNDGQAAALRAQLGITPTLRLFVNNRVPARGDKPRHYIEPSDSIYAPVLISEDEWEIVNGVARRKAVLCCEPLAFGWCLTNGGKVHTAERFDDAPVDGKWGVEIEL